MYNPDIHIRNDEALRYAVNHNDIEVIKLLLTYSITTNNRYTFDLIYELSQTEIGDIKQMLMNYNNILTTKSSN
jgi:hypothetical protein